MPAHTTYSSVASRDSVRIGFLLAALNGLKILACDIGNAYLNAPNRERVHVKVGSELFGPENKGKYAVIERALYGLKSASKSWRLHFADTITKILGYKPSYADNDVYIKECMRESGKKYYSYLIIYVDDVLCIHHNPKVIIDMIGFVYRIKAGSIEEPKRYLGMDIRNWKISTSDGVIFNTFALGATTYVREAIRIVKGLCSKNKIKYQKRTKYNSIPFTNATYRTELNRSEFCNEDRTTVYQNLVGMLRWTCELGRIDVLHETALLSQYLAKPREGHLIQAVSIFEYLEKFDKKWMIMDSQTYDIDWSPIKGEPNPEERAKMIGEMYPDAKDELPHNMPFALGKEVDVNVFVDTDFAGNRITRRSHTGIIIYVNCAPVLWYSKRQNTVETSTFSAEIIALKIAIELVEGLRYKLRMFGVKLRGPARVLFDNMSVVTNATFPESS